MRTICLLALAFGLTVGATGCGSSGGGGTRTSGAGTAGGATQVAVAVTGSAPGGASLTYGNDSTSYSGRFPLHITLPLFSRAGYYYVSVHLRNGGNVTCKLTIGNASSVGHARDGQKFCAAKLTNDYQGHWR